MNEHYRNLASPPPDAMKTITGGRLKGFTDINPQWKWEALTNEFGLCGVGWKFEIVNTFTEAVPPTGELMVFVNVNLYVKEGDAWSDAIPGFGGDFLIVKDKNGIHGNDEGYKMAITDALGTAAKMLGVAADVYRGRAESKYIRREDTPRQTAPKDDAKTAALRYIFEEGTAKGAKAQDFADIIKLKYKKASSKALTEAEIEDLGKNYMKYMEEIL